MDGYETPIPRVICGIAAVAMTAIIVGVSVILPARTATESSESRMPAASKAATPEAMGGATGLTSIDVVGVREPELSAGPCTSSRRPFVFGVLCPIRVRMRCRKHVVKNDHWVRQSAASDPRPCRIPETRWKRGLRSDSYILDKTVA